MMVRRRAERRWMLRPRPAAALVICLAVAAALTSLAFARVTSHGGRFDRSFGHGGLAGTGGAVASDVAVSRSGNIVVAGRVGPSLGFGVVRFRPDGRLDLGFGARGRVTTRFRGGHSYASAVVLLPSGRIVAVGSVCARAPLLCDAANDLALARYLPDGRLDRGFGGDGTIVTDTRAGSGDAYAALVDPRQRLVVAGRSCTVCEVERRDDDFLLVRYKPNGSLDRSFGDSGKVVTDLGGNERAAAVLLAPDGRIVAVGSSETVTDERSWTRVALVRYNRDGSVDRGFGDGGRVLTLPDGAESAHASAAALDASGRIVVAGSSGRFADSRLLLLRYNRDGSLDRSFGANGTVTTSFGGTGDRAADVAVTADRKIVAAGSSDVCGEAEFEVALARYRPDGTPDRHFGRQGKIVTEIGACAASYLEATASALALAPSGKIVVAGGRTWDDRRAGRGIEMVLMRLLP